MSVLRKKKIKKLPIQFDSDFDSGVALDWEQYPKLGY